MKTPSRDPQDETAHAVPWADLPPLLFVNDLVEMLHLTAGAVRKLIVRGELGPYFYIGRRLAVRRESLVAALKAREIRPTGPSPSSPSRSTPDRNFLEKVRKGKPGRTRRGSRRTQNTRTDDEDS